MKHYAVIILAAGMSGHMKTFKPLLEAEGMTFADRVISLYQQHGVDAILVTGGHQHELKTTIKSRNVTILENPAYRNSMLSLLQTGVEALGVRHDGFFVHPVDVPLVRPSTIGFLIGTDVHPSNRIIYPVFGGKRGHPVLMPASMARRISEGLPGSNLKRILGDFPIQIQEAHVADRHILFDIDTPDDFEELLARLKTYEIPTDQECETIFDILNVSEQTRKHGHRVAEAALALGEALINEGIEINMAAVRMGGLLHDIAKGQKKHDRAGGRMLQDLGFGLVGRIIHDHTDIPLETADWECKLVYLADKLMKGTRRVSLEQRYDPSDRPFEITPQMAVNIAARMKKAVEVKKEMECVLKFPLENIKF